MRQTAGALQGMVDDDGAVTLARDYSPFGVLRAEAGTGDSGYGFTGEQWNSDLALLFLRARHYAPAVGRFLSQDPWSGSIYQPNTLHKHAYAANNPVLFIDPSGREYSSKWDLYTCDHVGPADPRDPYCNDPRYDGGPAVRGAYDYRGVGCIVNRRVFDRPRVPGQLSPWGTPFQEEKEWNSLVQYHEDWNRKLDYRYSGSGDNRPSAMGLRSVSQIKLDEHDIALCPSERTPLLFPFPIPRGLQYSASGWLPMLGPLGLVGGDVGANVTWYLYHEGFDSYGLPDNLTWELNFGISFGILVGLGAGSSGSDGRHYGKSPVLGHLEIERSSGGPSRYLGCAHFFLDSMKAYHYITGFNKTYRPSLG